MEQRESFLMSLQSLSQSRNCVPFVEPEGPLLFSQGPFFPPLLCCMNLVETITSQHSISLRCTLIQKAIILQIFQIYYKNFVRISCISHSCYMSLLSHCKFFSSTLKYFLQSPLAVSASGPNRLLSCFLSYALSLCSSFVVRDQVSRRYKRKGKHFV